jgi:hypothetical protein
MHNLLGSLQIWERRRLTQKSCVQLSKYSRFTSQAYNVISCFYVHVVLIRNAQLVILFKIKYEPTWSFTLIFSVLSDLSYYLLFKPSLLFILMLFTYS